MPKTRTERKVKQLVIYHYEHEDEGKIVHTFFTNRIFFTADEMRNAPVISKQMHPPNTCTVRYDMRSIPERPNARLTNVKGVLHYDSFFPYGNIRASNKKFSSGGNGLGAEFEVQIYKHLLTRYAPDTPIWHEPRYERNRMLIKAGLTITENNLQEHFDAFKRLAEANRAKNEG